MQITDTTLLRKKAYIDGQWVDADDKACFAITNPADNSQIGEVAQLGTTETRRAIEAANSALDGWRSKTAKERASILRRWFDLMIENQEDLARILSWEQGKPLTESRGEIAYGASFIEWFAEEGKRIYGDVIPHDKAGRRLVVIKQPVGVVAAITPWNFPVAMITRKAGPALAAGCTMGFYPTSTDTSKKPIMGKRSVYVE
ncbi:aldehyde dehydrogenase family protein, partial [Haliea sp. E1-2-M8]|uniref:aldehyde dehydrogenase family protein n=1 Tax=Haliea sp. E1-2-M8 TaxID=3064706 RepID=UPI002719C44D